VYLIQLLLSAVAAAGRITPLGNPAVLAAEGALPAQVITVVEQRHKGTAVGQRGMVLREAPRLIQRGHTILLPVVVALAQLEEALVLMRQHLAMAALAGHRQLLARQ